MLRLRPFKPSDAETIVSWLTEADVYYKWSAGRLGAYPITAADIRKKYCDENGDCEEKDNFYPFTAFDEDGIAGHLILRFTDREKRTLRFGYVIVNADRRGRGCGREMISLALRYAAEILRVERVTIGAFENNPAAHRCYASVGFRDVGIDTYVVCGENWRWIEMAYDVPAEKSACTGDR